MSTPGSKNQTSVRENTNAANALNTATPSVPSSDHPEFVAALGVIVSAFVDIGFGASAAHLAHKAANDTDLIRLVGQYPKGNSSSAKKEGGDTDDESA